MNDQEIIFDLCQIRDDAYELMLDANKSIARVSGMSEEAAWEEFVAVVRADAEHLRQLPGR